MSPDHSRTPQPLARTRAAAWVLYDLANTVYAAVLTFVFTPWFTARFGATSLGATQTVSMILAGCAVPVLGALIDRTGRTRGYLVVGTLACIAALSAWGLGGGQAWLLLLFLIGNIAYNLSLLFYNALLPSVASDRRAGLVSGIGVGVGYLGTVLVLVAVPPGAAGGEGRFLVAGAMFLVFALPCLLLVRERRAVRPPAPGSRVVRDSVAALLATLRSLPRHRSLLFFLLANFCLVDVLNTAILFFADFTEAVFRDAHRAGELSLLGMSFAAGPDGIAAFLRVMGLSLNLLALLFGVVLGAFTDRAPLGVLRLSAIALLLALVGGVAFGGHSPLGYLLTLVVLGALGLAGVWTAGRKVVVLLAPRDRIGEFFGLYGITVKLSVLGSTVYGVLADAAGPRPAMLAQGVQLILGLLLLAMVRLPRPGADGGR